MLAQYSGRKARQVPLIYVLVAATIVTVPFLFLQWSTAEYLPICRTKVQISEGTSSTSQISTLPTAPTLTPIFVSSLELPSEYSLSPDQEMCERMYGRGYFAHIEKHQHPYCERSSSSFLQCFSAPRLPLPWMSQWSSVTGDPFCIAQGVYFNNTGGNKQHFKAHCNTRPDTVEFAEYWGGSGVGGEFKAHWDLKTETPGCNKDQNNGEWLFVIKREESTNIWHNIMGLWQAMLTLDGMQAIRNPATGRPWMSKEDVASMRIVFDDDIPPQDLDDWWKILNGKAPVKVKDLEKGACYGNVLLPLPGSSSPFWAALVETVYHEPCQSSILIDVFRRRVFQHLGIKPRPLNILPEENLKITFVNRTRTRKLWNADALMEKVRTRYPKSRVNVTDFETLPLRDQVVLAAESDVFIGHYGAGLVHLLFLPPGAATVEITSSRSRKFRTITNMRGIVRFEADCLEEPEYKHIVEGTPIPPGWHSGMDDANWQKREYAYMVEDDFLGWVDAAVRSQRNRRYTAVPEFY
ncbi:hypothetical protein H072_5092 [Dactylellina haptotyla CBS 200.50]|uniref:Glycosyltransferase 61 catalytic domain-containing protein n=1 Tax=Dactylellina haptotyla (strain CBS 200.50) TaxID=1284197 RepID=S8BNI0_DACHA|nr:hypothetical protein H072_5092 [Dactylellina haptotyla CBS 200.50]